MAHVFEAAESLGVGNRKHEPVEIGGAWTLAAQLPASVKNIAAKSGNKLYAAS